MRPKREGVTLIELLIACGIIGIAAAIAAPRVRAAADSLAVEAAARDVVSALALGRINALRYGGAEVRFDAATVSLTAGGRVVLSRNLSVAHGVAVRSTTPALRYGATGLGTGVSNGSVIISRGAAADTIVISRLGRVRR